LVDNWADKLAVMLDRKMAERMVVEKAVLMADETVDNWDA
jgi:hypothetical protein